MNDTIKTEREKRIRKFQNSIEKYKNKRLVKNIVRYLENSKN